VNVHKINASGNYSVASTRHPGVDNATEGELEHDVADSEAKPSFFHRLHTAQPGLCQRMLVREFEDRHQRATL
jgi:hypothetical protein